MPLAPFAANGVDLTSIDSLTAILDPRKFGGDVTVDALVATEVGKPPTPPNGVPDGGATLPLLCGCLALLSSLRRKLG